MNTTANGHARCIATTIAWLTSAVTISSCVIACFPWKVKPTRVTSNGAFQDVRSHCKIGLLFPRLLEVRIGKHLARCFPVILLERPCVYKVGLSPPPCPVEFGAIPFHCVWARTPQPPSNQISSLKEPLPFPRWGSFWTEPALGLYSARREGRRRLATWRAEGS